MRYEAELFVALTKLEHGTTFDISRVSSIPRSRVYDVAKALEEKGLIDINHSRPITCRAIPFEMAIERLKHQHEHSLHEALQALQDVRSECKPKHAQREEFWIISHLENVSTRAEEMVRKASQSILVGIPSPQLISQEMLGLLRQKAKEGLRVIVASPRQQMLDQLHRAVSDAEAILLPHYLSEMGLVGRLVIVDQQELLFSMLGEEELPGIPRETAIWSDAPGFAFTAGLFVEMAAKALQNT